MPNFKYCFSFRIHFETKYGQFIFIVGNIKELGFWDPNNGFQLNWKENNNWTGKIQINLPNSTIIEYKYVLCEKKNNIITYLKWEEGPNRMLELYKTSKLEINLDELWEIKKISLLLSAKNIELNKSIFIMGDCKDLANMKIPLKMKFTIKKDPYSKILEKFWEINFGIESTKKHIKYYYVYYDESEKKYYCERGKERFINLNNRELEDNKISSSCSDCIYYQSKFNKVKKIDSHFESNFNYHKVNENLLIGTFPYSSDEVDILEREGVKIILNINELEEFSFNMINWDVITLYYPNRDIEMVDFQIFDSDTDTNKHKIKYAAFILNNLIKNSQVYVHSTVGISKLVEIIFNYLVIYKHFSLEAAVKFIKTKCYPNKGKKKCDFLPKHFNKVVY